MKKNRFKDPRSRISILHSTCAALMEKKMLVKQERSIPKEFFENYKYKGKVPVRNVECHLAYIAALLADREARGIFDLMPGYSSSDIFNGIKDLVAERCFEVGVPKDSDFDQLIASYAYIYDVEFHDTYEVVARVGSFYGIYALIAALWKEGAYSDNLFTYLANDIERRMAAAPIKQSKSMIELGPWQYMGFCIVTDFIRQVSEGDFEVSEDCQKLYKHIQVFKGKSIKFTDNCNRFGKKAVLDMIEIMNLECHNKKNNTLEIIPRFKPYVPERTRKMIELAEQDPDTFLDAAMRELYFATMVMAEESSNGHLITSELQAAVVEMTDSYEKKYTALSEHSAKTLQEKNLEIKNIKNLLKTANRENAALKTKQQQYEKSAAPEVERLSSRVNTLLKENAELKAQKVELKRDIDTDNSKNAKFKSRIDALSQEIEKLKRQLNAAKKEADEATQENKVLTAEIIDMIDMEGDANSDSGFSEEDMEIARKCKFAFLVPSYPTTYHLKKLFPNSRFINTQESENFDIGASVEKVIICIDGIPHSSAHKAINQAKKYGVGTLRIQSYGTRRFFNEAVNAYKQLHGEVLV